LGRQCIFLRKNTLEQAVERHSLAIKLRKITGFTLFIALR